MFACPFILGRKRRGRKDQHVGNTQGVGDLSARDAKEFDAAVLAKEKKVHAGYMKHTTAH